MQRQEYAPDVVYETTKGDRAFFSQIINQAVIDACLVKRPTMMPLPRLFVNRYKKILTKIMACEREINAIDGEIELSGNSKKCPEFLLSYILLLLRKKEEIELEIPQDDRVIAYETRRFINSKNELFRHYASMLGFDPQFIERKCKQYIAKFDQGLVGKPSLSY